MGSNSTLSVHLPLFTLLALVTLAACGKPAPPAPAPAPVPTTTPQALPKAVLPAEELPAERPPIASGPIVELRINGRGPALVALPVWRGEPVIAEVVLRHPDRAANEPLVLEPADGGWSTRVRVAPAGGAAAWSVVVAGRPSQGALALKPNAVTTLVFRVTEPVGIGRHRLVARLELADGRAWRGVVESEPLEIDVVEPPATPAGAALGRRQLLRTRDALLAGDVARAEAAAHEMVKTDPGRPEGFAARALVAEARGDARAALHAIETAIALAAGAESTSKPVPFEYADLRRRFEAMVEK